MPIFSKQEHLRANHPSEQLLRAPGDRAGSGPIQPANTGLMTQLSLPFLLVTPPKKKTLFAMPECLKRTTANAPQGENNNPAVLPRKKRDRRGATTVQVFEMGLELPVTGRALQR